MFGSFLTRIVGATMVTPLVSFSLLRRIVRPDVL
jgi:hypothetical protein